MPVPMVVFGLVLASVGLFIALVHRITLLQVNHMLIFTGDQGRKVIAAIYPSLISEAPATGTDEFPRATSHPRRCFITDGLARCKRSMSAAFVKPGSELSGGMIELVAAVGDTSRRIERLMLRVLRGA